MTALQFLNDRGQLTAAGKRELDHPDENIALSPDQIKAGARAFLDQNHEMYLSSMTGYYWPPRNF